MLIKGKKERTTKVLLQAGQDVETSAMCNYQQQLGLDE